MRLDLESRRFLASMNPTKRDKAFLKRTARAARNIRRREKRRVTKEKTP